MILCKKCGFGVLEAMRHALKSNTCPSCGKTLFGDSHVQEMSAISRRIRSQEFSQSLVDDIIFDISLFILDNYSDFNEPEDTGLNKLEDTDLNKPEDTASNLGHADGPSKESLELIRDEIRGEAISRISEEEEEDGDETDDMKLSRLKRMAKMAGGLEKSGPAVRRVTT
jgi:hypothetical protein